MVAQFGSGTSAGILVLPVVIWLWFREIQKAKLSKLFKQNGGILLKKHIVDDNVGLKIFSLCELRVATEYFKESICEEEYEEVFMGALSCGKKVTIKRPKMMDKGDKGDKAQTHEGQNECSAPHEMENDNSDDGSLCGPIGPVTDVELRAQPPHRKNFPIEILNKVIFLSQIDHEHVVKLLGCCLEYHSPILVYEFVSIRTLFDHIHGEKQAEPLSWEVRLRIALETANALDYLYSSHSVSIFVTSSTILIDDEKKAKVSYFGASRLVPLDENEKDTVIQGARGYLDPEGSQLTDKSDVYSFGVVLAELLTGKKPSLSERTENLAKSFLSSVEENNLSPFEPIENIEKRKQFLEVAKLAKECLQDKKDDRPRMNKVVEKLGNLKRLFEQPPSQHNQEETEHLLDDMSTRSLI